MSIVQKNVTKHKPPPQPPTLPDGQRAQGNGLKSQKAIASPAWIEASEYILGLILNVGQGGIDAAKKHGLESHHFATEQQRRCYDAIRRTDGTLTAVAIEMMEDGSANKFGGANKIKSWLGELHATIPDTSLPEAIAILKRHWETDPDAQNTLTGSKYQSFQEYGSAVRSLCDRSLSKSELETEIQAIATAHQKPTSEVRRLYESQSEEIEREQGRESERAELDELLNPRTQIDPVAYLPGKLSKIVDVAKRLHVRPEVALMQFLAAVSGLLKPGSKIDLYDPSDFEQNLSLYLAVVGEPSSRKTPALSKIVMKPLKELEKESKAQWEREMEQYRADLRSWKKDKDDEDDTAQDRGEPEPKKPFERLWMAKPKTSAGLRTILNEQRDGFLVVQDEISGLFKETRSTHNLSYIEDLLSMYDGLAIREVLGSGVSASYDEVLFSIIGNIQPRVLSKIFDPNSDVNGLQGRFLFVHQPSDPWKKPPDKTRIDLTPMLTDLYRKIGNLPKLHLRLSDSAQDIMGDLMEAYDAQAVHESSQAMAVKLGKHPGHIGRLAANLHTIRQVWEHGTVTDTTVGEETLTLAVELGEMLLNEVRSVYADIDEGSLTGKLKAIVEAAKGRDKLTAREAQRRIYSLSQMSADDVRQMFDELAKMGYGVIVGKGNRRAFKVVNESVNGGGGTVNGSVNESKTPHGKGYGETVNGTVNEVSMSVNDPIDTVNPPPNGVRSETVNDVNEKAPPASLSDTQSTVGGDRADDTPKKLPADSLPAIKHEIKRMIKDKAINGGKRLRRGELLPMFECEKMASLALHDLELCNLIEIKNGYIIPISKKDPRSPWAIGKQVVINRKGESDHDLIGTIQKHVGKDSYVVYVDGADKLYESKYLEFHNP